VAVGEGPHDLLLLNQFCCTSACLCGSSAIVAKRAQCWAGEGDRVGYVCESQKTRQRRCENKIQLASSLPFSNRFRFLSESAGRGRPPSEVFHSLTSAPRSTIILASLVRPPSATYVYAS
jgi:hypothetical protein